MTSSRSGASFAGERHAVLAPDVDAGELRGSQLAELAWVAPHSHEIAIVQHGDLAVASALHVKLAVSRPGVHRRTECGQGILGRGNRSTTMRGDRDVGFEIESRSEEPR